MAIKTVLITGSTSGIGLGIAKSFAGKGYNIIFNGLEADGADIARETAKEFQVNYLFSAANMLDAEALRNLVWQASEKFDGIDVLVNNAGIQYVSSIENFPEKKWDDIIAINLTAPFHLIKTVWPFMKKNHFGRIINIASAHGLVASEEKSAYVASKHGIVGLTKTVALEGAPFNITSNAICPGFVKTPLVEQQIKDKSALYHLDEKTIAEKYFLAKHAVKEFVSVNAIGSMSVLLASEGSGIFTGGIFSIDGGWTAQ